MAKSFSERVAALPPLGVGLGFRGPLRKLFARRETPIACLEVVAEHFFGHTTTGRPPLFRDRPVLVHCLDFSLGTPGPLDEAYLDQVAAVYEALDAALVSDHLAITRSGEVELGHLNPVPPTRANVDLVAGKIRRIVERTDALFLLENITTHLQLKGDLGFADFYQQVCDAADCGMLFDVTNICVNCHNFGRDPLALLDQLDLSRVVQLHVVGYTEHHGHRFDSHSADIQEPVYELIEATLERAPVRAIILERDDDYPAPEVLLEQLERLTAMLQAAAPQAA